MIFNDVTEDDSCSESEPGSGEDDDDEDRREKSQRAAEVGSGRWSGIEVPEGFAVGNEPDALSINVFIS